MYTSKPFQLIIGCILLCLSSCVKQEGINQLTANNIEEEGINHTNLPSNYKREYEYLFEIVEITRNYIQSTTPLPNEPATNAKNEATMESDEKKRRAILHVLANKLRKEALYLLNGKKPINDFLHTLLTIRFDYLIARSKLTTNILKGKRAQEQEILPIIPLPTEKAFFDWLTKDEIFAKSRELCERLRVYEVDRYQLLNLLIKETFLRCKPNELKPETIHLLRASTQLHPLLLSNKSHEEGHPDEACANYHTLLSKLLIPSDKEKALVCLTKYKELALNLLTEEGKNLSQHRNRYLSIFYQTLRENEPNKSIQLILPAYKKDIDLEFYNKYFVRFLAFKGLGVPKDQGIHTYYYDDENTEIYEELPNLACLRTPVATENEIENNSSKASDLKKESASEKKKRPKRENKKQKGTKKRVLITLKETKSKPKVEIIKPSLTTSSSSKERSLQQDIEIPFQPSIKHETQVELTSSTTTSQEEEKEPIDRLVEETIKTVERVCIEKDEEEQEQKGKEIKGKDYDGYDEWIAKEKELSKAKKQHQKREKDKKIHVRQQDSRVESTIQSDNLTFLGDTNSRIIRLNQQLFTQTYSIKNLHISEQELIDELFDPKKNHQYTFKKFKRIWRIGGGKVSNNANGSHHDIFGPEQEPLCGLSRNHQGRNYGPHYVKYLQALARYVGLRPSWEMEESQKD